LSADDAQKLDKRIIGRLIGGMELTEARFKFMQIIHRTLFRARIAHACDLPLLVRGGRYKPIHVAQLPAATVSQLAT
jgi:hypothetical protein